MTGIRTSIYKAHQAYSAAYEAELKVAGLNITPQQATVLCAIAGLETPSQTNLVDVTGVDRSTMADVVRRLSSKGMLTRKRTRSDARRYAVSLTPLGQRVAAQAKTIENTIEGRVSANGVPAALGKHLRVATDILTRNASVTLAAAE